MICVRRIVKKYMYMFAFLFSDYVIIDTAHIVCGRLYVTIQCLSHESHICQCKLSPAAVAAL